MMAHPRIGSQLPRISRVPDSVTNAAAADVIEMAALAGVDLDPWQRWVLNNALGEREDGKWSAFEAVLVVPRQCGKSALLEALMMAALFVWSEKTVIYSAHRFDTAQETFMRLRNLIEQSEFADEVAKIYTANGKEAIVLKSGCRVKFMARSRGTGRGFSGDRIILDEAYDLAPASLGAMVPTMSARSMLSGSNPQIWYASSAAHSSSLVLHSLRRRALAETDPGRFFYAEWSAEDGADPDDRDNWYQANPALGVRISEEFVSDEQRALAHSPQEFQRERLGIPDPLPEDSSHAAKLPAEEWAATVRKDAAKPVTGQCTLAYDVSRDGEWASIVLAWGSQSSPLIQVIDHRRDVGWLPEAFRRLVDKWKPLAIGCNGAGPAGAQVGPVTLALAEAGIKLPLTQLNTVAYKQACGAFYTDVVEGRLVRPPVAQGPLDNAAAEASERRLGDAWAWDIRNATVPIAPLVAATVARALLPTRPPRRPSRPAEIFSF